MDNIDTGTIKLNNKKLTVGTRRDSSLELLRIVAMFMIIFHHVCTDAYGFMVRDVSLPRIWLMFIGLGGKIGVNLFVLISGYFLVNNTNIFNLKKIFKLRGEVMFYSLIIYVLFVLFADINYVGSIYKYIFPFTNRVRWFVSVYFVLYLIHPFINKAVLSLDKKYFRNLLLVLILGWIIILICFPTNGLEFNNQLLWFITLYMIAAYIRLYVKLDHKKVKQYLKIGFCFIVLGFLLNLLVLIIEARFYLKLSQYIHISIDVYKSYNVFILASSIYIFVAFVCSKMRYSKFINLIASTVFGIYLIHEHPLIKGFIWERVFDLYNYQYSNIIVPYSIIIVVVIFCLCCLIDLFRQRFIEKPFLKFIDNNIDYIEKLGNKILSLIKIF